MESEPWRCPLGAAYQLHVLDICDTTAGCVITHHDLPRFSPDVLRLLRLGRAYGRQQARLFRHGDPAAVLRGDPLRHRGPCDPAMAAACTEAHMADTGSRVSHGRRR